MNPPRDAHPTDSRHGEILRITALAACDGTGLVIRHVSLLLETHIALSGRKSQHILAIGRDREVDAHPANARATLMPLPNAVLIPGLVNAHTHLDLTHIGPQPHDPAAGFVPWVDMVRARRHTEPADIAASVRRGIELSLAGGVVAVGDIAGAPAGQPSLAPYRTLLESPLLGNSYLEFFGIGKTIDRAKDRITAALAEADAIDPQDSPIRVGLQPHAPNTIDLRLYQWAAETAAARNLPLSTHLAETPEEHEFIAHAAGPQRQFLERMGIWDDSILATLGRGQHPVRHLRDILAAAPFTVAHVNDADDAAIQTLAQTQTSVVYCPRASAYFAAESHFGPHRYREMIAAGVNVALGTDSIVNLPPQSAAEPASGGSGLSTLDEMRFLHRRDRTDPVALLRMATLSGAAALGLDPALFRFTTGSPIAGILAIDAPAARNTDPLHPFASCLANEAAPSLL